jgi:dephospho-CoA kinase
MKLIGIAGTNGAGKDSVGSILAEKHGFMNISVSDLLREECRKRGLPVERENLRAISAEWRREGGLGVLVDKAVATFEERGASYKGLAVGSLRNPGEVDRIHENGGIALWVDADARIRYERIQHAQRGRDGEDDKTFEQFLAEEQAEMQHSGDEATLNMAGVKALSDLTIKNEGDQAALEKAIVAIVEQLQS